MSDQEQKSSTQAAAAAAATTTTTVDNENIMKEQKQSTNNPSPADEDKTGAAGKITQNQTETAGGTSSAANDDHGETKAQLQETGGQVNGAPPLEDAHCIRPHLQQQALEQAASVSATPNSISAEQDKSANTNNGATTGKREQDGTRCNLTLVLHEKLRMELEQRPLPPKPADNQVTLATHTVGICGSDVKYWQHGSIGPFVLTKPMILGHETSAIVIEVGANVENLRPGDKVAVEVGLPCSSCSLCKTGRYNLCSQMAFAATPPFDGTLTRYFNHPADFCFKLPEAVSLEEGALLEPLAVAVHACKRAPIRLGDIVLVCGAGAVGLLSMLAAKAFGAGQVIVTDVLPSRLNRAHELGADLTLLVEPGATPQQLASKVREYAHKIRQESEGVDVVLECSGAQSSLHLAIYSANTGSSIVCVGCQPDSVTIPLQVALMQEVDIKGLFRYRNCYPLALSLVEAGKINLKPLVTHRFKLEESVQAFETFCRGEGVKILIKCMNETR